MFNFKCENEHQWETVNKEDMICPICKEPATWITGIDKMSIEEFSDFFGDADIEW